MNPSDALNLSEQDLVKLRKLLIEHKLPLSNPVLIVEVLVNKHAQTDDDDDAAGMKFTFSTEDLKEVFGQFGKVVNVELYNDEESAQVTF